MTPVIPYSVSNITFIPGAACTVRKNTSLTRCSSSRKHTRYALPSQRFILPLSTSVTSFGKYGTGYALHGKLGICLSTAGTDVAVEESDSSVTKVSSGGSEIPSDAVETSEDSTSQPDSTPPTQSKRARPVRKSEMPPVKNEELIPGAMFTGKVRSIQPFGAFVDFGAFTDGLVHVSRLSNSFVKDVASVVSVGQEVQVRLVEVNTENGRISLSMRENDDASKRQPRKDGPASTDKARPSRKNASKSSSKKDFKSSKFVKGQELDGTVKNLTRSGAFISLPEGEEGFLPQSEEADDGLMSMMGNSSLQIGQEVKVRVLRITRGQVTLTMKKEEDDDKLDSQLSQGVVYTATNPFMLAFRKNKEIAAFLDQRERAEKVEVQPAANVETTTVSTEVDETVVQETDTIAEIVNKDEETAEKEIDDSFEALSPERSGQVPLADVVESDQIAGSSGEVVDQVTSENSVDEESTQKDVVQEEAPLAEDETSVAASVQEEQIGSIPEEQVETPLAEDKTPSASSVQEEEIGAVPDENGNVASSVVQPDVTDPKDAEVENEAGPDPPQESADDQIKSSGSEAVEEVENQPEDTKDEVQIETPVSKDEIPSTSEVEEADSAPQKNDEVTDSNGSMSKENVTTATISPALVKQLREETGAGMMDCKKALAETGGDIVKAQEFLRKKGLASAEKKSSRVTAEGRIGSYIHDSRIGVLVEVNCETDFVSRGDIFKELVDDLAMQVAACPQVQYLVPEDVPEEIVNKEREIEMQKEDLLSKPEHIRSKIVEGRIQKRIDELALLEQPYIKNDKMVVKDWVKQTIATIGENIKVKRFVRFNLGEGLEKKSQDFAAEVAAQTAAKPISSAGKEQSTSVEVKETDEKPKAAVSAALVKQLREETGAGMMDCKKALSETGGDLEKAQEYLRKKGLSTADKKSSRLAAEGRIGSYIHDSRIGVLIEVNCETDFVGRSEKFKELVDVLAMQVVASPQVQFVSIEDIPESIVSKEKELEMQRDDLASKPENIREKIVEGRVSKRLGELALLEQPFIKDDSLLVKDLVKQTVAALGENIKVRRFVRFTLGETTEDTKTGTEA
ncbi:polyprotein of EF-Ts, chloroplastic isoform X2 [Gossypium arboreum]|uniref:polyprotein of EF-Ts, chloroplastic isoform X2 n=1 Tax=Gossypium arboreum TaxID=29729 RepID=UPI0022F1D392|nr:polyprotein of EF-Ts, chloroplastic isoform X2 [Gossypium arboreum]XP_052885368.1 polyprotein of EF-Ts, chloroplastic isoform X2 [Gossypium arboreum]